MFKLILIISEQIFVPVTMIIMGLRFIKRTPMPESGLGFRTRLSLSSERAWLAAHSICGKTWLVSGIITLIAAAVVIACIGCPSLISGDADRFIYGQWAVQYALCAGAFPVTELALKKLTEAEAVCSSN